MKKDKILKILFIISFIPYILIILYGVHGAIFGEHAICIDTCPPKVYGLDAFMDNIFLGILALTVYGVIPVIVIYEIFYIFYYIYKRRKQKRT